MKFSVSRSVLLEALNIAGKCVSNKGIIPILECYLFNIDGDRLSITGSNLEVFLTTSIEISGNDFKKSIAIPAVKLNNLVRSLPECPVEFTLVEQELNKKLSYSIKIKAAQGNYNWPAENGEDYPKLINVGKITLETKSDDLLSCINKTLFSCSWAGNEPYGGLQLCFDKDNITCTGTNGNSVSTFTTPIELDGRGCFILPVKLLGILQSLPCDETIKISVDDKNIVFVLSEDTTLRGLLVDFNYPDCERVIPVNNPNELIVNRQQILLAIKRVNQFSNQITNLIVFKLISGELEVVGEDTDFAQGAVEKLEIQYNGTDVTFGVNGGVLINGLSKLTTDEVHLYFSSHDRPVIVKEIHEEVQGKSNLILLSTLKVD